MSNQEKLTTEEQSMLVKLLNKLEPGLLPQSIFSAIARLIVTATYLAIPLFEDNGVLKVQLLERDADDPYWPGQVALPGKIILSTDKTLDDVYARLIKSEISDAKIKTDPIFCDHIFEEIIRGREISLITSFSTKHQNKGNFMM